jgi:hypothetical protein
MLLAVQMQWSEGGKRRSRREASYEGIGNSGDLSRRRILRFLRASLICA